MAVQVAPSVCGGREEASGKGSGLKSPELTGLWLMLLLTTAGET